MSIQTYEKLVGKYELSKLIDEGMEANNSNNTRPFIEAVNDITKEIRK